MPYALCPMPTKLILFDGVCNFCNGTVNYIMDHDDGVFQFAALQSDYARKVLSRFERQRPLPDSVLLIDGNRLYEESDAALRIAAQVRGWKWLAAFRFLPKVLRDSVYRFIARRRYRWFGKQDACRIPTPAERARFPEWQN